MNPPQRQAAWRPAGGVSAAWNKGGVVSSLAPWGLPERASWVTLRSHLESSFGADSHDAEHKVGAAWGAVCEPWEPQKYKKSLFTEIRPFPQWGEEM